MSHRVLLVSPAFQGYWRAVSAALEAKGWEVDVHIYDQPGSPAARAANILAHAVPGRAVAQTMNEHLTNIAVHRLQQSRPNAVIVMRGDQLTDQWWDALTAAQVPTVTWAYDELRRMHPAFAQRASVGVIATYAAPDAEGLIADGLNAFHLPLAFDTRAAVHTAHYRAITFIGARYGNREAQLHALHRAGVPVVAFGKTWSARPLDRLRSRRVGSVPFLTGPNLSRPRAYGVMSGSLATLNIHGDQEGFTMRTFEAAGVGAVQIIDRDDVDGLYSPGAEVLTYGGEDELIDLCEQISRGQLQTDQLREAARKRTLAEHTFDHRIDALLQHL